MDRVRWRGTRLAAVGALAVIVAVGALARSGTGAGSADATKSELAYVLLPHPDDEIFVWSLLADRPEQYPVFVVATQGESTGRCGATELEANEQLPEPEPRAPHDPSCGRARVNSFLSVLEAVSGFDPSIERPPLVAEAEESPVPVAGYGEVCRRDGDGACTTTDLTYDLYAGSQTAVLVFNLGDGDLTADEAAWALDTARAARSAGLLPTLRERAVIAPFDNPPPPHADCPQYHHRDHAAAHAAVRAYDRGLLRLGATCATDPAAATTAEVPEAFWTSLMEVAPDGERRGAHQRHYGWLIEGPWPYSDGQADLMDGQGDDDLRPTLWDLFIATRQQTFWTRGP